MNGENHIIVAGFGRSGTTWLSDIMSKVTGRLLLFEPLHPCVLKGSHEYVYRTKVQDFDAIEEHLRKCHEQLPANRWLLRNHLNHPIENVSHDFISYLWENTTVGGYKTIRGNHFIDQLSATFNSSVLFILRHPLAVLMSIKNRENFWKEYESGFDIHQELFFKHAIQGGLLNKNHLSSLKDLWKHGSRDERIVMMWCVSLIITMFKLPLCPRHYILSYEDLYTTPFEEIRKILGFLSIKNTGIHPAHFLTPSMTSLRTMHGADKYGRPSKGDIQSLFWKGKLSATVESRLLSIIKECLEPYPEVHKLCAGYNYL